MAKTDKIMKKYRVKMIGSWVAMPEHLQVLVFDAPNMETVMKMGMEPEVMAWLSYNTSELIPVMTLEESMKLLK
jgi:hypothetical protein